MTEQAQRWGPQAGGDLSQARRRLLARLADLEGRLLADPGDEAVWRDYVAVLDVFLRLEDRLSAQDGPAVLTTKEMADRLGISVKTLLARKKRGVIHPSLAHGKALGWRLADALRDR